MDNPIKVKKILIVINIIIVIFIFALIISLGFYYFEDLKMLSTQEGQIAFSEKLQSSGILSVFILFIINVLQVVVAFIPGEFIEIISGMLFGPYLGALLCLMSLATGTVCIFGLVKLLGRPFVDLSVSKKHKFKFLENETRTLIVLFFIFLIPGTPKDFITYTIPFTKVKMWPFVIVSTLARIPSVITSTLIGNSIINKEFKDALIITTITCVIAFLGIIFNKPITNKVESVVKKVQEKK